MYILYQKRFCSVLSIIRYSVNMFLIKVIEYNAMEIPCFQHNQQKKEINWKSLKNLSSFS